MSTRQISSQCSPLLINCLLLVCRFQMLYADSYLSREDFRKMFDHSLYDRLRKSLDCEKAFPEVYGKVNRKVRD